MNKATAQRLAFYITAALVLIAAVIFFPTIALTVALIVGAVALIGYPLYVIFNPLN